MRRRQWVREGDLIIVWPWDFQDSKADVKHRYTKTQAMYLSRKGVLPEVVDLFGTSYSGEDFDEDDDLFGDMDDDDVMLDEEADDDDLFGDDDDEDDDDDDDLFGGDDDDDLFGDDDEEDGALDTSDDGTADEGAFTPVAFDDADDDEDVTDGVDELFG